MRRHFRNILNPRLPFSLLPCLLCALVATSQVYGDDRGDMQRQIGPGQSNWQPSESDGGNRASIVPTDLCTALQPTTMVQTLLSPLPAGVTTSNEMFNGLLTVGPGDPACIAGGTFVGGGITVLPNALSGPVGFPDGVVLSSGNIASITGGPYPAVNTGGCITTNNNEVGDVDLDTMGGTYCTGLTTRDRAALEFDIVSTTNRQLVIKYVFASEEYNEWVNTGFNDAAAIFVNGAGIQPTSRNRARFPGCHNYRVCVNSINTGTNSWYYQSNTASPPPRDTEMDGLTNKHRVMYSWAVTLQAGLPYHVKLVVADTRDYICDSVIFAKGSVGESSGFGSCRVEGHTCMCIDDALEADCENLGGLWDAGAVCGDLECGLLTGACCGVGEGCTAELTLTQCHTLGGTYAGDGTVCGDLGACCSSDSVCTMTTEECCTLTADGGYWSETTCSQTDCIPTGNCCLGDGVCGQVGTAAECAVAGGEYQGNGTVCVPGACDTADLHGTIPAVSEWGVAVMVVLLLAAGTIVFRRYQAVAA